MGSVASNGTLQRAAARDERAGDRRVEVRSYGYRSASCDYRLVLLVTQAGVAVVTGWRAPEMEAVA